MSWHDWRDNYATDCYYYSEDKDMGASIPWCSHKHCIPEDGDCSKNCKRYICTEEVTAIINRRFEEEQR